MVRDLKLGWALTVTAEPAVLSSARSALRSCTLWRWGGTRTARLPPGWLFGGRGKDLEMSTIAAGRPCWD